MVVYRGSNTDCKSSEPLKTLVTLCYVILLRFWGHHRTFLGKLPCAAERFVILACAAAQFYVKRSISVAPEKVLLQPYRSTSGGRIRKSKIAYPASNNNILRGVTPQYV